MIGSDTSHRSVVIRRLAISAGFFGLALAFLVITDLGLHHDDYANKYDFQNVLADDESPILDRLDHLAWFPTRFLGGFTISALAWATPTHEFWVRLVMALGVGLNGLLLGSLVLRLTGSRLAGVLSGWLYVVPSVAWQAISWIAAWHYIQTTTTTLLFLHVAHCMCVEERWFGRKLALAAGLLVTTICLGEATLSAIGLLPMITLIALVRGSPLSRAMLLQRTAILFTVSLGLVLTGYYLLYANSEILTARGDIHLDPRELASQALDLFRTHHVSSFSRAWALPLYTEQLTRGVQALASSLLAITLSGLLLATVVGTAVKWRTTESTETGSSGAWLVVALGVVWFTAGIVLPAVLARGQAATIRQLYYPLAGLSLIVGGLASLVQHAPRGGLLATRALILLVGGALLLNAVSMLGVASFCRERDARNVAQIAAFSEAVMADRLPSDVVFVPFATERSFPGGRLYLLFPGVFETYWSTIGALVRPTGEETAATGRAHNRWLGMTFKLDETGDRDPSSLQIQGLDTDIDRVLMFSYDGGRVTVIRAIHLQRKDGSVRRIEWPLAVKVAGPGVTLAELSIREEEPVSAFEVVTASGGDSPATESSGR